MFAVIDSWTNLGALNKRDFYLIVTLKRNDDDKAKRRAEKAIQDICRATRRRYSAEEKIRIVL